MSTIAQIIITAGGVLSALAVISAALLKIINKNFVDPILKKFDQKDTLDCKRYLVDFLNDVEHGVEKDEEQWQLAHETYDHYINDLNENSYVHDKWERVTKK